MSARFQDLVDAPAGARAVLQGNVAFALGCVRAGVRAADGYPGTPSTEVIDKGLRFVQDRMCVGWSVNEATATALAFGVTMAGADAVVTMKVPGLFQAADVVASVAQFTAARGALVIYVASDFVPSSTQYLVDPRYFLKSCGVPILEPRTHQEMLEVPALAVDLGRRFATPVAVLANGLLCHSEGLVTLGPSRAAPPLAGEGDYTRFMNLPEIARRNYDAVCATRLPGVRARAEELARLEWHDRALGVVVHGLAEAYLREVWDELPVKPSILSLPLTYPLPRGRAQELAAGLRGPIVVLGDGLRFVQEELLAQGLAVEGKRELDPRTEWSPAAIRERLGAAPARAPRPGVPAPVPRPPTICAGCSYRAFGLAVARLRKKQKIVASFGDIGCNTLLYFMRAIDTCACMGAADGQRQGAVLADPTLAGRAISVCGDSTECHAGLDSTRNAAFRNIPGVKVVLDNRVTAMTGGQPAPSSPHNLAGEATRFDLAAALAAEGARVQTLDAFDLRGLETALREALERAAAGELSVLVVRGPCMRQLPDSEKAPRLEVVRDRCARCDLCFVCPGLERDEDGYPRFTHLCTACGGQPAVCAQLCNKGALQPGALAPAERAAPALRAAAPLPAAVADGAASAARAPAPAAVAEGAPAPTPRAMRVAVRGVGGQGILFVGKVLAEVALRAGYERVLKGETHGMAQLGGAVLSTFACGDVHSPVFAPGTADVLVALEAGEVLRPGFLDLLKPEGVVVLDRLRLLPAVLKEDEYPSLAAIRAALGAVRVVELDLLAEARALGDSAGRCANVIALGVLSTVAPLAAIPVATWREALLDVTSSERARRANLAAFDRGRLAVG
ncbi:MAG TPA: 2-oxoacid:acceptor oxidoreductase family protein [Polyangia bacterium]|jgi:indolepyruvate ferredoxin oxidoreductase alpha subunit